MQGRAVLGAEGNVNNDAGEGLRHNVAAYRAPLGLAPSLSHTRGGARCLALPRAGLLRAFGPQIDGVTESSGLERFQ